ncbi:MAG: reverse transcriptase domain-containing protein [Parcubacteria group bacterium]
MSKHISHLGFPRQEALILINNVISRFDSLWRDSKKSQPEKGKYVRSAAGTPLHKLLRKIDRRVLAPYDGLLPNFIFGGKSGVSHVNAAYHILGDKRQRSLLKLDLKKFFEQVDSGQVARLFEKRLFCDRRVAKIISNICCVPLGPKGASSSEKTIARGFATSSRLAVWCNLDVFFRLDWLIKKRLRGHDPRLVIYVDDIGISASRISEEELDKLAVEIKEILESGKYGKQLLLNDEKKSIRSHSEGMEFLGTRLRRNKLSLGGKSYGKREKIKNALRKERSSSVKKDLKRRYKGIATYKRHIESFKTTFQQR